MIIDGKEIDFVRYCPNGKCMSRTTEVLYRARTTEADTYFALCRTCGDRWSFTLESSDPKYEQLKALADPILDEKARRLIKEHGVKLSPHKT